MVVDPATEQDTIWIADCDECGLTIWMPLAQREHWLQYDESRAADAATAPNISSTPEEVLPTA